MLKKGLNSPERVRFGPFAFDRRGLFLTRRGRTVEAPKRSLAALARLTEEPGLVVTKSDLMDSVWGSTHVSPTSLGEAMSRLRSALDDDPRNPRYVQTVHGRGYRFVGALRARRGTPAWASVGTERPSRAVWAAAVLIVSTLLAAVALLSSLQQHPDAVQVAHLSSDGREARTLSLPAMDIADIAVAPDGQRVALSVGVETGSDIWLYEPERESMRRLTTGGESLDMLWSPDGEWLVYASRGRQGFDLVRRRTEDGGAEEVLLAAPGDQFPESFSADGRRLIYSHTTANAGLDLATLSLENDGRWVTSPLLATPAHEYLASLAPDGGALAFVSDISGRWAAYVQRLVPGGEPMRVSRGGVRDVFWSADGSAIQYLQDNDLVRVDVGAGASPRAGGRGRVNLPMRVARADRAADGGFLATVF